MAVKCIRICEKIPVEDIDLSIPNLDSQSLEVKTYFLHLAFIFMTGSVHDTIAAELIVIGSFTAVTAICLILFAKAVFASQRLINIIPDKSALVSRFSVGELDILKHISVGVTHGVCVFAKNEWLICMSFQELFNVFSRSIHLAVHIRSFRISRIMIHSLIMHKSFMIQRTELISHL